MWDRLRDMWRMLTSCNLRCDFSGDNGAGKWCIFLLNLGSRSPEIENVFGFCFWVGDVWCLLPHSKQTLLTATRKSESMQDKFLWCAWLGPCSLIKMSLQIGDEMLYYTKISINYSTQWIYFMNFMGLLPQPGSKPAWSVADFNTASS